MSARRRPCGAGPGEAFACSSVPSARAFGVLRDPLQRELLLWRMAASTTMSGTHDQMAAWTLR